jgi:prepilin-type N-terminal cleavage/methylation domain-containing protein
MHSIMKISSQKSINRALSRGFSLVELVVASSIAAAVFGAGAILFHTLSVHQNRHSSFTPVTLGNIAVDNYYPINDVSDGQIDAYEAPNYGRAAMAENLRDIFWADMRYATAVYCLGRDVLNTYRPSSIPLPLSKDARELDSPEAFRLHLATVATSTAAIFTTWRGSSTQNNGTIFILEPSGFTDSLAVRAVYEIDIQATAKPLGTYASVRRYNSGDLSDFYDVFYTAERSRESNVLLDGAGNPLPLVPNAMEVFKPLFVFHEREERLSLAETDYDKFKNAKDMPFYFIWWPDPAANGLIGETVPAADYASNPTLTAYGNMGGKSAFMFTVPMIPGL